MGGAGASLACSTFPGAFPRGAWSVASGGLSLCPPPSSTRGSHGTARSWVGVGGAAGWSPGAGKPGSGRVG